MRYREDWSWKPPEEEQRKQFFRKKKAQANKEIVSVPKHETKTQRRNRLKAEDKRVRKMVAKGEYVPGNLFHKSRVWRQLRRRVFKEHGRFCGKCHATKKLHIDHINPRALFPELQLTFSNLQVLCEKCNVEKMVDYGPDHDHRIFWDEAELVCSAKEAIG